MLADTVVAARREVVTAVTTAAMAAVLAATRLETTIAGEEAGAAEGAPAAVTNARGVAAFTVDTLTFNCCSRTLGVTRFRRFTTSSDSATDATEKVAVTLTDAASTRKEILSTPTLLAFDSTAMKRCCCSAWNEATVPSTMYS